MARSARGRACARPSSRPCWFWPVAVPRARPRSPPPPGPGSARAPGSRHPRARLQHRPRSPCRRSSSRTISSSPSPSSGDTAESLAEQLSEGVRQGVDDRGLPDLGEARSFASGAGGRDSQARLEFPRRLPGRLPARPVLVYHDIGAQRDGLLRIAASTFEEQMRYLKREGYRAIRLEDFLAHLLNRRQLPKKSVLLTFDDGYKGFLQYADPVLKELGFHRGVVHPERPDRRAPEPELPLVAGAARAGQGGRRGPAALEDPQRPAANLGRIRVGLRPENAGGAGDIPSTCSATQLSARRRSRDYRLPLRGRGTKTSCATSSSTAMR